MVMGRGQAANLGKWAAPIPKNRRCARCRSRKTKPNENGIPHWYRGHPNGDYAGQWLCDKCRGWDRNREVRYGHRRVIERRPGHECCLLPNTEVSFINGNKKDWRYENVEILWKGDAARILNRIPEGRRCMKCGGADAHGDWKKKRNGQFICNRCRNSERNADLQEAREIEDDFSILAMQQRMVFDPNFKIPNKKRCARCGLTRTGKRSKSKGGGPDWYKLKTGTGPIRLGDPLQCSKCYGRQYNIKQKQKLIEAAGGPEAYEEAERLRKEDAQRLRVARRELRRKKNKALQRARREMNKALQRARRIAEPPKPPKRCAECGSYRTRKDSMGYPNWYKLGARETAGGLYQCGNCYESHRKRRVRVAKAKTNVVRPATSADFLGTKKEEGRDTAGHFTAKIWLPFEQARSKVRSKGLKSFIEFKNYLRSEKPTGIPSDPHRVYKNKGWIDYFDFLGFQRRRIWRPFLEAKEHVRNQNLQTKKEYAKWKERSEDIPAHPDREYKREWNGWGDWLGTGAVASFNREYRSFEQARSFVHSLRIKNQSEWWKYCKSEKKPTDIPSNPAEVYEKDWKSWGGWFGTYFIATRNRKYLDFEAGREKARSLGLKSWKEWRQLIKSGKLPADLPKDPRKHYKNKGWISNGDWFRTGTIALPELLNEELHF